MLYLYQSDRLAFLAETAVALMQHEPLADAWTQEQIVVQSQGMRRYLSRYLAERAGIAANMRFVLPASLSWSLTRQLLPDEPALNPFSPAVLQWRLLQAFETGALPDVAQTGLAAYLGSHDAAAYHLAGKVADVFDQYLVYRPEWLDAWARGKLLNLGDDEAWQADLWRFLWQTGDGARHRGAQQAAVFERLSADVLPARYLVFGVSSMPPVYVELLQQLAKYTEVHVFSMNPCAVYWGDAALSQQEGHPLLASLGRQGRDFFDRLHETAPIAAQYDLFVADEGQTLLQRLQADMRHFRLPEARSGTMADGSIVIQAAHSPLRELQVLKEWLLQALADDATLQPHQIAVLMPDVARYAPFIAAVFGDEQAGSPRLPYSIADVRLPSGSDWQQMLRVLLALMQSRFELEAVLPLLDCVPVRRFCGWSDEDVAFLRRQCRQWQVRWGADEAMRREYGGTDALFTWQWAAQRTALGWLMDEASGSLWAGVVPHAANLTQMAVQARFFALLDALREHALLWRQAASVAQWCERLLALIAAVAGDEADGVLLDERQETAAFLADWQAACQAAGMTVDLTPTVACRHFEGLLTGSDEAGFLRGGITFCGMVPMRSLPFDVLCVLGLNDGRFPRQMSAPAFDLVARHPKKGDRVRRDDDRYLFLEAVISAQKRLYLSYEGKNIDKNEELAPSPVLAQLCDVLARMCNEDAADFMGKHIKQHPLQPFSPRYFVAPPQSVRLDYAQAWQAEPLASTPFVAAPSGSLNEAAGKTVVAWADFVRFWRHPLRDWLRQSLQWRGFYLPEQVESAELYAFSNDKTARKQVREGYLKARLRGQNADDVADVLRGQGWVPAGLLGEIALQSERDAVWRLPQRYFDLVFDAPQAFVYECEGLTLTGSFDALTSLGQVLHQAQADDAPDEVAVYLQHLLYAAHGGGETHGVFLDKLLILPKLPQEMAQGILARAVHYYRVGQNQPLPFFPKTSLETVKVWRDDGGDADAVSEKALAKARQLFYGNETQGGQITRMEEEQVFGRDETSVVESALFWDVLREVWLPLLCALSHQDDGVD